jgi:hypothetical protein
MEASRASISIRQDPDWGKSLEKDPQNPDLRNGGRQQSGAVFIVARRRLFAKMAGGMRFFRPMIALALIAPLGVSSVLEGIYPIHG